MGRKEHCESLRILSGVDLCHSDHMPLFRRAALAQSIRAIPVSILKNMRFTTNHSYRFKRRVLEDLSLTISYDSKK